MSCDPFSDYFARMLRNTPGLIPEAPADEVEDNARELLITKRVSYIDVPDELLMDYGVIPDTRPPRPRPSRRTRLRWWITDRRAVLAKRAYRLIAGYDPYDGED